MILLEQNTKGSWVREAQRLLAQAGFNIKNTGVFDAVMEQTVNTFQQQKQLPVTGKIDTATWGALGWDTNTTARGLKPEDITAVAEKLGVEVAAIKAVYEVESRGSGFLPDGRPKILFEGHIFWAQLKKAGKNPEQFTAGNEDILFPKWTKEYYKGNALEYERLNRAQNIDHAAALAAASWGTFQIMGFNYPACGYGSVQAYVDGCYKSEGNHLMAFASFITAAGLVVHLKNKNWAAFAKGYNGPAYAQNSYDTKLASAYKRHSV